MDADTLLRYLQELRHDMRFMEFDGKDERLNEMMAHLASLVNNRDYQQGYEFLAEIRNRLDELSPPTLQ